MYNGILFLNLIGPEECTEENRSKADFGGVTFKLKVQVEVTPAREEEQHK